jgi:5S rRNA maturation endonuclease (ribonuclease M5)
LRNGFRVRNIKYAHGGLYFWRYWRYSLGVDQSTRPKDLTDFITQQLQVQGVRIKSGSAKDIQAYCPQGHDNKSASFLIRRADGMFICFGCGIKGRNWNHLKRYLPGIELLPDEALPNDGELAGNDCQRRLDRDISTVEIPWDSEPWTEGYKHVRLSVLQEIGARSWFDGVSRCWRILFPIAEAGELVNWTARRLDKSDDQRYRNYPGVSAKNQVFPFDYVAKMRPSTVVVVEGPYDALRLVNYGIPALAILGTKNWDINKVGLISRVGFVGRIILALDNDTGGQGARLKIALDLKQTFEVDHFIPPPERDPGDMSKAALDQLAALI